MGSLHCAASQPGLSSWLRHPSNRSRGWTNDRGDDLATNFIVAIHIRGDVAAKASSTAALLISNLMFWCGEPPRTRTENLAIKSRLLCH